MRVLENIPNYNDEELLNLFTNAMRMLEQGKQTDNATLVIDALKDEWRIRAERAAEGIIKTGAPKEGLLKKIGYKVGKEGASEKRRRQLLDFIITADPLPFVWSPAYMEGWGKAGSPERYNKLTSVIRSLSNGNQHLPNIDKAIIEWQTDLDYLDQHWKEKIF